MASVIEVALYGEEKASIISPDGSCGDFEVFEFCLTEDQVRLRVGEWDWRFRRWTTAVFCNAMFAGVIPGKMDDEAYFKLPWPIRWFSSERLPNGSWNFQLNCINARWFWTSDWPSVEHHVS